MSKWIEIGAIVVLGIIAIRVIGDYLSSLNAGASATNVNPNPNAFYTYYPANYRRPHYWPKGA